MANGFKKADAETKKEFMNQIMNGAQKFNHTFAVATDAELFGVMMLVALNLIKRQRYSTAWLTDRFVMGLQLSEQYLKEKGFIR